VIPPRSPRLAEAGPDDRDVVARGHAQQGRYGAARCGLRSW
jgi:hypothetical protein